MKEKTHHVNDQAKRIAWLRGTLKELEGKISDLEAEDKRLNSVKDALRKKSKELGVAGSMEEKAGVDKEQRQISKDITTNNDKLEECQDLVAEKAKTLANEEAAQLLSEQALTSSRSSAPPREHPSTP